MCDYSASQTILSTDNIISIIEIIVTLGFGLYAAIIFTAQFAGKRSVKDFLISENIDIKQDYNLLIKAMFEDKLGSKEILGYLKLLTIRIENYEELLNPKCKSILLILHNKFKKEVTLSNSLNDQYRKPNVIFNSKEKIAILNFHKKFSHAALENIVKINKYKTK